MENPIFRYIVLVDLFRAHLQELHYYEVSKESDVSTLYFLKSALRDISDEMASIERLIEN